MCLKTTDPVISLNNATFDLAEDESEGRFCLTDLLYQVSAYWGGNLTWNSGLVNGLTEGVTRRIPETFICQDCIYGALALVEDAYPGATRAEFTLAEEKYSVAGYLNPICAPTGFPGLDKSRALPVTIEKGATNQTEDVALPVGDTDSSARGGSSKRAVWMAKDVDRL